MNDSTNSTLPDAPPPLPTVRPIAVTVICMLGFIGAVFTIPLVFTSIARQIGCFHLHSVRRRQSGGSADYRTLECFGNIASRRCDCDWILLLVEDEMNMWPNQALERTALDAFAFHYG